MVRRLDALTALRFIAATMIVLHHSRGNFGIPGAVGDYFNFAQAVTFFFILSGFVLAYSYPTLSGLPAVGRFYRARIARLWPLHFTTFVLAMGFLVRRGNAYLCQTNG